MIKLEANNAITGGAFYFYNIDDCRKFMYVFKDHWCNVPWKEPVEISDSTYIDSNARRYMSVPPKKRAEDNLSWGFNLVKRLGINLNNEQNDFVNSMMNGFGN